MNRVREESQRSAARVAGGMYLFTIATWAVAFYARTRIVVDGEVHGVGDRRVDRHMGRVGDQRDDAVWARFESLEGVLDAPVPLVDDDRYACGDHLKRFMGECTPA